MSDNNYWEDDDNDENDEAPAQVNDSKTIKALRAKIKADETRFSEQAATLEALVNGDRERTVKEILEKKGANPKVARLALKDLSEITDENVDAWLKDNAEALNLKVVETPSAENTEDFDELSNQDALTSQAVSPGTGGAVKAKIDSFKTVEEITAWANSLQK